MTETAMLSPDRIPDLTQLTAAAADYDIVRRAIGHIREHWRSQPEIEAIAEAAGVTSTELTVRKVSYHGRVRQWTLNPVWVRLDRDEHKEFGIERLFLVSHGRRLPIAGFLGAREKESFALALSGALAEAKRGPTRTIFAPET